jgi:hypothetical protein
MGGCSPSLLSRCAVVNFETGKGGWNVLKEILLKSTLKRRLVMDEQWELINELIEWLSAPLVLLTLGLNAPVTDLVLFCNFSKLYVGMLGDEANFSSLWLQNSLLFSIIWAFGSMLDGSFKYGYFVLQ